MKILIATPTFPGDLGGPALYAKKVGQKLFDRDWCVSVVSYGEGKNIKQRGKNHSFRLVRVSRRIPFGVRHLVYSFKLFFEGLNANVIYALDATAAGLPAAVMAFIFRKKFLVRIGGDLLWERAASVPPPLI